MQGMVRYLLVACVVAVSGLGSVEAAEQVLVSDDFSAPSIDNAKWGVALDAKTGGFARIEQGTLHVLSIDSGVCLVTAASIPPAHVVEFDYYQPGDEKSGGYQNTISYHVTKKVPGQQWNSLDVVWYLESSGSAWSTSHGLWGLRASTLVFRNAPDTWYRVKVVNTQTLTTITIRDRDSGTERGRTVFAHDKVLAGDIRFEAGATKGGRWGFKLDNVRVLSLRPDLPESLQPLLSSASPQVGESWRIAKIAGREFWHLTHYAGVEAKQWGMDSVPLFAEAAWLHAPVSRERMFAHRGPFTFRPPQSEADRKLSAEIAREAGDRFLGYYPPMNEWGEALLRYDGGREDLLKGIKTRREGLAELERLYRQSADSAPIPGDVCALDGFQLLHHQAFEWGARSAVAEIGENIPCTNVQFAFIRGAAREYGRPWGVDLSAWYRGAMTAFGYTPDYLTNPKGPFAGHSVSLHKRLSCATYLAGANFLWYEYDPILVTTQDDVRQVFGYPSDERPGPWMLSPVGEAAAQIFALAAKKDRGAPYTPIALIVDFAHGWSPESCSPHLVWGRLPLAKGDHMLDEFFNTIYPWNPARAYDQGSGWKMLDNEQGYLVNAPWGDIFDVFTTKSCRSLDSYPLVMMIGEVDMDPNLSRRLMDYVKAGGSLVINAEQAARFPVEFLGVRLTGEKARGQAAVCKLDQQSEKSAPFEYHRAALAGAEAVVTEPDRGDVLVSRHTVGKGCVLVTTPSYLLDENNRALPLLSHLLDHLTSNLLPVRVSSGVQFLVNNTQRGWVVGLINNKGVTKQPVGPPQVKPEEEVPVTLRFEGRAKSVEEWLTREQLEWAVDGDATTITLSIPPGDVRIVEIVP